MCSRLSRRSDLKHTKKRPCTGHNFLLSCLWAWEKTYGWLTSGKKSTLLTEYTLGNFALVINALGFRGQNINTYINVIKSVYTTHIKSINNNKLKRGNYFNLVINVLLLYYLYYLFYYFIIYFIYHWYHFLIQWDNEMVISPLLYIHLFIYYLCKFHPPYGHFK